MLFNNICLAASFLLIFVNLSYCGSSSPTTNYPVATTTTESALEVVTKSRYEKGLEDYDEAMANRRNARGMMIDEHSNYDYHHTDKPEQKAVKEDPWASYYDFAINEGSFKFWAVFQLVTAVLLIYSAFAAVYYAKFNVITTDYDYYDEYFARSNTETPSLSNKIWSGLSAQTFQRIFDALSSKKYS